MQADAHEARSAVNNWVVGFVALAVSCLIGHFLLATGFATAGERMTRRVRVSAFSSILRHDIG